VPDTLLDQHDVQERQLGKLLVEKGFAGILGKSAIGDINLKTGITGLPWMQVGYV